MNRVIIAALLLALSAAGVSLAEEIRAEVKLTNFVEPDNPRDGGTLELVQRDGKLTITGTIHYLTPAGLHGFHVHEKGTIDNKCNDAGPHYNPLSKKHGGPNASERHIGDLGNVLADANGDARVNITDSIALLDGDYSIMGRSLVVHAKQDDLGLGTGPDAKTTGNSGPRVACGVVEKPGASFSMTGSSVSLVALLLGLVAACWV